MSVELAAEAQNKASIAAFFLLNFPIFMNPKGLSPLISRLIFTGMVFIGESIIFQLVFSPVSFILFLEFLLLS